MDPVQNPHKVASVIIAAYNEARTIANVIRAAKSHPQVDEVIVVDDGSRDRTAAIAREEGAIVLVQKKNKGKALAMDEGVKIAKNNVIFFMDADLVGLNAEAMDLALRPVFAGTHDMFALIIDRGSYLPNFMLEYMPLISGIRAMKKWVWYSVPPSCKKRFQIELAVNFFATKAEATMGRIMVPGLGQVIKERKRGLLWGLYQRFFMIRDITLVIIKMYVFYNIKYIFSPESFSARNRPSSEVSSASEASEQTSHRHIHRP